VACEFCWCIRFFVHWKIVSGSVSDRLSIGAQQNGMIACLRSWWFASRQCFSRIVAFLTQISAETYFCQAEGLTRGRNHRVSFTELLQCILAQASANHCCNLNMMMMRLPLSSTRMNRNSIPSYRINRQAAVDFFVHKVRAKLNPYHPRYYIGSNSFFLQQMWKYCLHNIKTNFISMLETGRLAQEHLCAGFQRRAANSNSEHAPSHPHWLWASDLAS
jgi:hypothetical protein